jgi:hypothetical protein
MSKGMVFYSIMWAGTIIIFGYIDWLWLIGLVPMALGDLIRRDKIK